MNDRARPRGGERGLTLFEALIMLAVTALIGALLLPMTSSALTRNRARAESALSSAANARGEAAYRALVSAALPEAGIAGGASAITFVADPDQDLSCAPLGARTPVTLALQIEQEETKLVCAGGGERAVLASWPGRAAFAYSTDGAAWASAWRGGGALETPEPNAAAPFVRLETRDGAWVGRAGAPAAYVSPQ